MAGSSFGTIFRLTTWGESHGKGVGVVVDGVPARTFAFRGGYSGLPRPQEAGTEPLYHKTERIRYRSDFIRHFRRKNDRYPDFHGGME